MPRFKSPYHVLSYLMNPPTNNACELSSKLSRTYSTAQYSKRTDLYMLFLFKHASIVFCKNKHVKRVKKLTDARYKSLYFVPVFVKKKLHNKIQLCII